MNCNECPVRDGCKCIPHSYECNQRIMEDMADEYDRAEAERFKDYFENQEAQN